MQHACTFARSLSLLQSMTHCPWVFVAQSRADLDSGAEHAVELLVAAKAYLEQSNEEKQPVGRSVLFWPRLGWKRIVGSFVGAGHGLDWGVFGTDCIAYEVNGRGSNEISSLRCSIGG